MDSFSNGSFYEDFLVVGYSCGALVADYQEILVEASFGNSSIYVQLMISLVAHIWNHAVTPSSSTSSRERSET